MAYKEYKEEPQPARAYDDNIGSPDAVVSKIKNWQQDAEGHSSAWETKQDKWHKLRMRIKKTKTFPFVGCSNIRMPTLEIQMRKQKAALTNIVYGIRPVIQAVPTPTGNWESARKIEKWLDHIIMDKMDTQMKSIIATDQMLEKGMFLMKPFWRYETTTRVETVKVEDFSDEEIAWLETPGRTPDEMAIALTQMLSIDMNAKIREDNIKAVEKAVTDYLDGKKEFSITIQDCLYNGADIALASPERVYVPSTTGYDPQKADYIIHEYFLPYRDVISNAEYKGWDKIASDEIKQKGSTNLEDKQTDITKDEREGIERLQSQGELVKIWECYCWYDINNDGVPEKCVITIAPDFSKLLRKISLPFHSGKFPFVKLFWELTDDRWFSHRGLPEIIEDIVKEIDIQHMQKIDYGTLTNSPMYIFRSGQINKNTMQFRFGQGIPAKGMQPLDDIMKPIQSNNPNINYQYEREQMILETKVSELVGQVDYSLQSMINKREPRTLGEVNLQANSAQQVFSLDANLYKQQHEELFNWIYDLYAQYADDDIEFRYFGQDSGPEGELIKLSREEIQNKPKITIRGNDQNTNPMVRLQKAQMILQMQSNPMAAQMGIVNPMTLANAYKRAYQEMDIPNWEELLGQPTPPPPPPPPMADVKLKGDDLTDAEKAQVLQQQGIQPDIQGRMLNEENRRQEKDFEQMEKAVNAVKGVSRVDRGNTSKRPK